jgi:hypothetical protein
VKLRVEVPQAPRPHLLRAAIEARLAGRPWTGPEARVADAVAKAAQRKEPKPWR